MSDFKNNFSWSISRDSLFRECKRKYYYNYYGSWGGWERDKADKVTRTLYVLKNLQNIHMWKGSTVHWEIERILKELISTTRLIPKDKSVQRVTELMREQFRSSRERLYWNKQGSMKNEIALFEHEYKTNTPDHVWKSNYDDVILCLQNFYNSEVLERIEKLPKESVISIESMTAASFSFSPEIVFVKLDLAVESGEAIEIVDWKTGKSESADLQFRVYTLFAHEEYDLPPDKITVTELNLLSNQTVSHTYSPRELIEAQEYISKSIGSMKSMLTDPDENIAEMSNFPRTENERICESCKFKKICFDLD
jgi:PD-(D/E)XK nuclease superfamily protein